MSSHRKATGSVFRARFGNIVLLLGLLVTLFLLHVAIPGTVPTGAEGGRWLALAKEAAGSEIMSADVTHPSIFSTLIAILLILETPPIAALLAAALLAKASLVVAVYLTSLTLNRIYATVTAALVATTAAQADLYAQGDYPQLLGMAFGLLAVFLVVRYIDTQESLHLWFGLGLAGAALATDLLIAALLPLAFGVAIAIWFFLIRPAGQTRMLRIRIAAASTALIAAIALVFFLLWARSGGDPTLNPFGNSRWDSLSNVFGDAPWPWAALFVGAVIVSALRYWPAHIASTLAVAAGWLVTSGMFFLITGEQSGLLISQMSVIILAVLGFGATHQHLAGPESRRYSMKNPRSVRHRLLFIAGFSLLSSLVVVGLAGYLSAADQYRLVNYSELSTLDRLRAESGPGDVVVAARGKGGMPVGWWVEGYAELPTYTGQDLRALAFPDERDQAQTANDIFSGSLSEAETITRLSAIGADYLVVDRRGLDSEFLNGDLAGAMRVVDDTSSLVILDPHNLD